jgi:hypothetical protein
MGLTTRHEDLDMSLTTSAPETGSAIGMAVKATPPVAVSGATLLGVPVADWVQYVTLLYVVAIAARAITPTVCALWKLVRDARKPRSIEE